LNTTTSNRYNTFAAICDERNVELIADHKSNTGISRKSNALIIGELLGGIILLPQLLGLRLKNLNAALNDNSHGNSIGELIPEADLPDNGMKLMVMPELLVLEITPKCCNQIVDWADGEPCLVIPKDDTPPELIQALHATGDNFTILPVDSDKSDLLRRSKEVLCSTVDGLAIEAIWYNKPLSFMIEGRSHDVGPFRLLNILLSNDCENRHKRLNNFLNSEFGGFFLPGKQGLTELRTFLAKHEDNHERFTNPHRS